VIFRALLIEENCTDMASFKKKGRPPPILDRIQVPEEAKAKNTYVPDYSIDDDAVVGSDNECFGSQHSGTVQGACAACSETVCSACTGTVCDGCKAVYCRQCDSEVEVCPDCSYASCTVCQGDAAKGACRCPDSHFGISFADMPPHPGSGKQYHGPRKSAAQIAFERMLVHGFQHPLENCANPKCSKSLAIVGRLSCDTCRSVTYCSAECLTLHSKEHEPLCGPYVSPEQQVYISREVRDIEPYRSYLAVKSLH